MKTKIVYVLVSSEQDVYLEQAYVSMYSLKHYVPDAHIVLLTDNITVKTFVGIRNNMVKYVDEMVVVELDANLNAQKRSRQLKTSVRNRIEGDFLFIDCDTIVTSSLEEIDKVNADIAACRDTHSDFAHNPYRDLCLAHGHLLDWPIDDEKDYFNSGVIFVKDVAETHDFYRRWNENLNIGYTKNVFMDQPSFAKTNYEMGHIIQTLPDIWNCELKHGIRFLKDALIVHYLCTNPSKFQDKQLFLLNEKDVLLTVKQTGLVSDVINEVIEDPFKGIAEITHCFAGEDVYFFRSFIYKRIRSYYRNDRMPSSLVFLLRVYNQYDKIKKMLAFK